MLYAPRLTIFLLIILTGLAVNSPAFALEMSPKRDCVVCHIMWMDDFRTGKETLVEWQPSNVLMKDTQGVVSSEEICYSCHDGYVNDSRHIVWKFNRHKTFVKPSKNVTIPPYLYLSVKGEIYCGTCHSAHGKGAAPHGDPSGKTSLFRETNIDSSLCEKCHSDKANYKQYNGHQVHKVSSLKLPKKLFRMGSKQALDRNIVICQSCHRIHGAKGDKLLIVDNKESKLCLVCHQQQDDLIGTKHDLRLTLPDEKNIKKQTLSASGPCGACHTPHNAAGKKLWARPLRPGNPASQLCLTCHGEDTGYRTKRIGQYSHPINVKPGEKAGVPAEFPLFSEKGEKSSKGRVQCFTCHDIHRWDPVSPSNKGGKDVEGDASNSFLRISNSLSTMCLKCHADKKQLITSDHNLEVTAPEEKNIQGLNTKVSGPCGACHVPHNAEARFIWAKKLSGDKDFVSQLCTGCHNKNGSAKAKLIGENYHPVDVSLKKFNISTTLPLYEGGGGKTPDGEMVCITCHEPHVWDSSKPAINYSFKNMEGDASNSFLRKASSPFSDLCEECHIDNVYIDGTDHDLNVTAPEAKNLLGQTVKESGQCGACHLVHNSPNKLRLWARDYGSVSREEEFVDALCKSCHSKGNIAGEKIPLIATHPKDKLINNIMRCNRESIDYNPIYDRNGKEINVGNISCPTCHNVHNWSPLAKEKGVGKNLEGKTTNSFLRNVSYNNICIDCHGLDAIFRYKYYHDPMERVEKRQFWPDILNTR